MNTLIEKLEIHDELNPKLWNKENKLKAEVKERILKIVDLFQEGLDIPLEIADIQIVGSNASYNYNDQSDLDAHIIVNFDLLPIPDNYAELLYNYAKKSFNDKYDISIHGVNVELYVDNIKSNIVSNGIYSIYQDKWLKVPEPINPPNIDISKEVEEWKEKIDDAINQNQLETLKSLLNEVYLGRRFSLSNDGEFGKDNLIFKELRNQGYIDRIKNKIAEFTSKELTLEHYNIGSFISRYE